MYAPTQSDLIACAAIALLLVGGGWGLAVADRRDRRRRAMAWHVYFHRGGLVRTLMAGWKRTPRLTDRREDR